MAHWTNHEIRRLREMHADGNPTMKAMAAAFDRHPGKSTYNVARRLGLRCRSEKAIPARPALRWLRLAHQYFARREAGRLG